MKDVEEDVSTVGVHANPAGAAGAGAVGVVGHAGDHMQVQVQQHWQLHGASDSRLYCAVLVCAVSD